MYFTVQKYEKAIETVHFVLHGIKAENRRFLEQREKYHITEFFTLSPGVKL